MASKSVQVYMKDSTIYVKIPYNLKAAEGMWFWKIAKLLKFETKQVDYRLYSVHNLNETGSLGYDFFGLLTILNHFKLNGVSLDIRYSLIEQLLNPSIKCNLVQPFKRNIDLYPFQERNVTDFLASRRTGHIVAHEPGLGKTIIAAEYLRRLVNAGLQTKVLWVVPKNDLAYQVQDELLDKFNLESVVVTSKTFEKYDRIGASFNDSVYYRYPLIITTWNIFRTDVKESFDRFIGLPFWLVLDEVHIVNEYKAKINKDVYYAPNISYQVCRKFPSIYRLGLTGTPQPNGVWYELASIIDVVAPLGFPSNAYFKKIVSDRKAKLKQCSVSDYTSEISKIEKEVSDLRQSYLMANLVRNTKDEIIDQLPRIIEINFPVDLNKDEETIYENLKDIFINFIDEQIPTIEMTDNKGNLTEQGAIYNSARMLIWQAMRSFSSYGTKYIKDFLNKSVSLVSDLEVYKLIEMYYGKDLEQIRSVLNGGNVRDIPKNEVLPDCIDKYVRSRCVVFANRVDVVIELARVLNKYDKVASKVILGKGNRLTEDDAKSFCQNQNFDDSTVQEILKWFWFPWSSFRDLVEFGKTKGVSVRFQSKDNQSVAGSVSDLMMNLQDRFTLELKWDGTMPTEFSVHLSNLITELEKKKYYRTDFSAGCIQSSLKSNEVSVHFEQLPRMMREDKRVLVVTDVLMEGVNLQVADCVIFYDYPMSIRQREQRLSRVHRIGSIDANIMLINIVCGLEKSINRILKEKYRSGKDLNLKDPNPVKIEDVVKMITGKKITSFLN